VEELKPSAFVVPNIFPVAILVDEALTADTIFVKICAIQANAEHVNVNLICGEIAVRVAARKTVLANFQQHYLCAG